MKKVKNWSFNKIPKKRHYSGIKSWYWHPMVLTRSQKINPPPLEPKFEGVFVEEEEVHSAETMTNEGKGLPDDKE